MSITWNESTKPEIFTSSKTPLGDIIDEKQGIFYSVDYINSSKGLFYITDQITQKWCYVRIEDYKND